MDTPTKRYKVMKELDWKDRHYVPGTEQSPTILTMTEAEAKDWVADGHLAAA